MAEASIHFLLESIGHADAQYQQQMHYCMASVEALVKLLELPGKASPSPRARGKKKAKKQLPGKENCIVPDVSVSKPKLVEPKERSLEPKERPCLGPQQGDREVSPQFYEIKNAETQQKQISHVSQHFEKEPGRGEFSEFLQTHEEPDAGPECFETHEKYRSGKLTGPEFSGSEFRREEQETGAELQEEKFLYSLQTYVEKEAALGIRHSLQIDEEQPSNKEEGPNEIRKPASELQQDEQESDPHLQHEEQGPGAELQYEEHEQDPELEHEEQETALVEEQGQGPELKHEEEETALEEQDPECQHEEQEPALELQREEQEPGAEEEEEPGFEHQYQKEPDSELHHEKLVGGSEPRYKAGLEHEATPEKQEERLEFVHSLHSREERPKAALQQVPVPEILHWELETVLEAQHEKQCEFSHEEQEPGPELRQGDEQDELEEHEPGHEEQEALGSLQTHEEQKGSEEEIPVFQIEPGSHLQFDQYEEQQQKQEAALELHHSLQTYKEQEVALEFRRHSRQAHDEQTFANLHEEPGSENLKFYQHEDVDEEQKQYEEQEPSLKVLSSRQVHDEDESLLPKRKQELVSGSFQSAQHEEEEPVYHEKQHPGHFLQQQDTRVEFLHSLKTHQEQPCPKLQREPGLEFLQFRECEEQKSNLKITHPFKKQSLCERPCLELPTLDVVAIHREPLQDILPQSLNRGPNEGCWRPLQPCREVSLGSSQPEPTNTESSSLKSSNLVATMRSFLPLVVQQQSAVPYANGKKDVRVKALEAAEGARKQEEKRAEERKLRKMELLKRDKCNDAAGVTARSKRPLGLRSKIEQEKSKKLEEEQRRKDEEWKKKEMELNAKKRKKEEVEKREREDKRRKVGDMLRQKKEQEERLRAELDEKEQRRKALEEAERERKATEEDMKRQRRLEKEREIERRRKAEEDAKTNWLAAKEADRKRREETFQRMKMLEKEQRRHVEKNLSTSDMVTGGQQDSYEMQREQSVGLLGHAMRVPRSQAESRVVRGVSEAASFAATSQLPARGTVSMSYAKSSMGLEGGPERYVGTPAVKSSIDPRKPYFSLLGSDLDEDDGPTSYELSPYRSSSDEEDEEEERPQKPVPRWARKENLMPLLMRQAHVDPDEIFTGAKSCSLNQVFGTTGNKKRRDFTQRSDSGDWLVDMVTWKEELQYKKSMGFLHPGPH